MQYVGGKFRQRKHFKPAILAATTERARYLEPFVGGGSMLEVMAPHFGLTRASDVNEDLVLLYQALMRGWEPPVSLSREEYVYLKTAEPSALRAFAGFGASYGGKWFGGYTEREKVATSARSLAKTRARLLGLDLRFSHRSYEWWQPQAGTVVYADPPYADVGVGFRDSKGFDHPAFWLVMDEWVGRGAHVFVSEFSAPPHWVPITTSVQRLTLSPNSGVTRREEQGLQHDSLWVPAEHEGGYG